MPDVAAVGSTQLRSVQLVIYVEPFSMVELFKKVFLTQVTTFWNEPSLERHLQRRQVKRERVDDGFFVILNMYNEIYVRSAGRYRYGKIA
jgi:hypothetical protein